MHHRGVSIVVDSLIEAGIVERIVGDEEGYGAACKGGASQRLSLLPTVYDMMAQDEEAAICILIMHGSDAPLPEDRVDTHVPDADVVPGSPAGRGLISSIRGFQVEIVGLSLQGFSFRGTGA